MLMSEILGPSQMPKIVNWLVFIRGCFEAKGKFHPRTGHEDPEGK